MPRQAVEKSLIIAPEDELKSISLIKNTLIRQNCTKKTLNVTSANILAETTKIKHDLDEAFKDLLSVSASLRDIENRHNRRPASRSSQPESSDYYETSKIIEPKPIPVPAPRKRPTTLDIKASISHDLPIQSRRSLILEQCISNMKESTTMTEKVYDGNEMEEKKSITGEIFF